jgi:hypothetical protein
MLERLWKLGYLTYEQYRAENHWKMLSSIKLSENFSKRDGACNIKGCMNKGAIVHHKDYSKIERELLCDLVVTCQACYDDIHQLIQSGVRVRKAFDIIRRIKSQKLQNNAVVPSIRFSSDFKPYKEPGYYLLYPPQMVPGIELGECRKDRAA